MKYLCVECGQKVVSSKHVRADGYLLCPSCADAVSAPVSDRSIRISASARIIVALVMVPFSLVVGPIALFLILARFVATGRHPAFVKKPPVDLQAAATRAALAHPKTTIH